MSLIVGLLFGLSLATKISALVLLAPIGLALITDFFLIFLKKPHRPRHWLPHLPKFLKHLIKYAFLIALITTFTFLLLEPYALIDFKTFQLQTVQQSTLTNNPFYFPYTLQYVGKIPYVYELKNIFFWGLGPLLAALSFTGVIYFIIMLLRREREAQFAKKFIIFVFFLTYFFITGRFAVGFMRYMLPLYPLLCLFAALLIYAISQTLNSHVRNKSILYTLYFILYTLLLIWPLTFVQVYAKNNTRTDATNWINQNIPARQTLTIKHWDDGLPLSGQEHYRMRTLASSEPDTAHKLTLRDTQLEQTSN